MKLIRKMQQHRFAVMLQKTFFLDHNTSSDSPSASGGVDIDRKIFRGSSHTCWDLDFNESTGLIKGYIHRADVFQGP